MLQRVAHPRIRELIGEPVSARVARLNRKIKPSRAIRVTFYPCPRSTPWTVVCEDIQGNRRWERTVATSDAHVGIEELAGRELAEVLRLLLRAALENLD